MPVPPLTSTRRQSDSNRATPPAGAVSLVSRMRQVFLDSPLCVQIFSPAGQAIAANQAWAELWGAADTDWHGYNILEDGQLKALELTPLIASAFQGTPTALSPFCFDPAASGLSGRARWVQCCLTPLTDESSEVAEIALIYQDITDFKKSEDALRFLTGAGTAVGGTLHEEGVLEGIIRLAVPYLADWCLMHFVESNGSLRRLVRGTSDLEIEMAASEAEADVGVSVEAAFQVTRVVNTGAAVMESLDRTASHDLEPSHRELLEALGVSSYMCIPLNSGNRVLGTITFVSCSGRYFFPADLALAEELAGRAALAIDNARLYLEAQEARHSKDEFLVVAAHELRTPLTTLLGYAHLLLGRDMDETTRNAAVKAVERNAWSLSQLINDIVDIIRVTSGKVHLDLRPMTLRLVVEAAVESLQETAQIKRIRMETSIDPAVGIVSGDAARLQQVVWHLLSNAIKFTGDGGLVQVQVTCAPRHARIVVSDSGEGINPDVLPYIFETFRQADSTATRRHSGLGMGLTLVRYLVEMHGGRVHAASPGPGKGSTFTVELPLVVNIPEAGAEEPHKSKAAAGERALRGLRILAVERHASGETSVAQLEDHGAEVRVLDSAAAALEVLEQWQPHALVVEVALPGQDGFALIRKIRALDGEAMRQIPAVAITSHMRTVDRLRALSAGYQAHISKPLNIPHLAATIGDLMHGGS